MRGGAACQELPASPSARERDGGEENVPAAGEGFHRLGLRFSDPSLEAEYRRHASGRFLPQGRLALVLALVVYSAFAALDPWILPEAVRFAWLVRFAVVGPLIAIALASSLSRRAEAIPDATWVILGLAAGGGMTAMLWARQGSDDPLYYAGVMLVCFHLYCFTRMRFVPAAATAWTVTLLHAGAAAWKGGSVPSLLNVAFFLAGANVIGMFACHSLERSARVDFLQQRRIRLQAEELRTALSEVRTLQGLIPVCAWCRKIRDDRGFWKEFEDYVSSHSGAVVTHGICPECSGKATPP